MQSRSEYFPNGLANRSDALGRYLMDHVVGIGARGTHPGFLDRYYYGRRPTGIYLPRYVNVTEPDAGFLRGFGYQGGAGRDGWMRAVKELGIGAGFKDAAAQPGPWKFGATAFGEMLPSHANRAGLDPGRKDKWGLPVLKIDCAHGENERLMRKDMFNDMADMLEHSGVKNVTTYDDDSYPGACIHEMGTARMGRDRKTSVLNAHNQVWDAPNVFVTDGSCMASTACQNPSLTYMAITARAADFAVNELKRRNL
jgi:choline dehydrogenase-like flavoprotein